MRWLLLALTGALLCTLGDHLHATHGVLTYRHVDYGAQAWWVPPLFAAAALASVAGTMPLIAWAARRGPVMKPDLRRLVADGIGFFAAYAYTSFADHARPLVTTAVLVTAFVVRVIAEDRPAWLVVSCLLMAATGVLVECLVSSTGGFWYLHPDLLKTPYWLGGIYLHAGLLSGEIAAWFSSQTVLRPATRG